MRRWQDDVSGLLIFCVDVHMGLDPLPRPHASILAWPLRVDVINGWPPIQCKNDFIGSQKCFWLSTNKWDVWKYLFVLFEHCKIVVCANLIRIELELIKEYFDWQVFETVFSQMWPSATVLWPPVTCCHHYMFSNTNWVARWIQQILIHDANVSYIVPL